MRYHVLACDYDGTIATDGHVPPSTIAALERVAASGRRLVLVTGRDLALLDRDLDRLDLFDRIVTDNGGYLYDPRERQGRRLTDPPDERLVAALRAEGVPFVVGDAVVATSEPHQHTLLEVIARLGLELGITFNKGAVMVLPTGITKASGLAAALAELGMSPLNAVGVGDAENDHAFLAYVGIGAAVANALPVVKERADLVLDRPEGAGVEDLAERLLGDDLRSVEADAGRWTVAIGTSDAGDVTVPARGRVLVAGPSGSGKSTLVLAVLEHLGRQGAQFVLVDPEGDYDHLDEGVVLGTPERGPASEELMQVLDEPDRSVAVNLLGEPLDDRPAALREILSLVRDLRATKGRPHWLVVDEAHHMLPEDGPIAEARKVDLDGSILITVHPEALASPLLDSVDHVIAVGPEPSDTLQAFATAAGRVLPDPLPVTADGQGLLWALDGVDGARVTAVDFHVPQQERQRHKRKYAEGELPPDRTFRFRGPDRQLDLPVRNLRSFIEIGEGVDEETWTYHRGRGDYSRWVREAIKDAALADEIESIEREASSVADGRRRVREAIERVYSAGV